jgi:hypothetical protein
VAGLYDVKGQPYSYNLYWNVHRCEKAVESGLPIAAIAARQFVDMQGISEEVFARHLTMLRDAGLPPFRGRHATEQLGVTVVPMFPIDISRVCVDVETLSPERQLVQPFTATPGRALDGIDVAVYSHRRRVGAFDWSIDEIDPSGTRRQRACGRCTPDEQQDPAYLSLRFKPFVAAPGSTLQLYLGAACDPGFRLRVPKFPVAGDPQKTAVLAFLYYRTCGETRR